MDINAKIMRDLRIFFLSACKNPEKYCQRPQDFTRKSKLNFTKLTLLMISLLKSHYKLS